ncbi:MAG: hypothetical protein MZW92_13870 [Comamonadaceae bacterium]|nr:hypothetical protein [Comamonadaceae bacterium]
MTLPTYERLGVFYLGREYDPATQQLGAELLYDSRDLTTHAVCIGMTGSGKTGLCLSLLEEAADRRHPGHRHRPQGRPRQPAAHLPRAAARGLPALGRRRRSRRARASRADEFAARHGRAVAQGPRRVGPGRRAHRSACATPPRSRSTRPAADAGRPLSILRSLRGARRRDRWTTRPRSSERISSHGRGPARRCSASTPTRSRAASTSCSPTILDAAWRKGESLDLAALIRPVQKPPFDTRGRARPRELSIPAKDRFELAHAHQRPAGRAGLRGLARGRAARRAAAAVHRRRASRASPSSRIAHLERRRAHVLRVAAAERGPRRGCARQPGTTSLRALLLHGRDLRLLPAGRQRRRRSCRCSPCSSRRAPSASAWCWPRRTRSTSTTRAWPTPAPGSSAACRPSATRQRVIEGLLGRRGRAAALDRSRPRWSADGRACRKRMFLMQQRATTTRRCCFRTRWALSYLRGPLTLGGDRASWPHRMAARVRVASAPAAATGDAPLPPATARDRHWRLGRSPRRCSAACRSSSSRPQATRASHYRAAHRRTRAARTSSTRRPGSTPGRTGTTWHPIDRARRRTGAPAEICNADADQLLDRARGRRDVRRRAGQRRRDRDHKRWHGASLADHVYRTSSLSSACVPRRSS